MHYRLAAFRPSDGPGREELHPSGRRSTTGRKSCGCSRTDDPPRGPQGCPRQLGHHCRSPDHILPTLRRRKIHRPAGMDHKSVAFCRYKSSTPHRTLLAEGLKFVRDELSQVQRASALSRQFQSNDLCLHLVSHWTIVHGRTDCHIHKMLSGQCY
jgi:hypothetical protein